MRNLFLMGFWLALAAVLFLWGPLTGRPEPVLPVGATAIPMGWIALGLAGFNLLRWWSLRPRRPAPVTPNRSRPRAPEEYNPEFDFDREGPARH